MHGWLGWCELWRDTSATFNQFVVGVNLWYFLRHTDWTTNLPWLMALSNYCMENENATSDRHSSFLPSYLPRENAINSLWFLFQTNWHFSFCIKCKRNTHNSTLSTDHNEIIYFLHPILYGYHVKWQHWEENYYQRTINDAEDVVCWRRYRFNGGYHKPLKIYLLKFRILNEPWHLKWFPN